jgi:hypothetical protein
MTCAAVAIKPGNRVMAHSLATSMPSSTAASKPEPEPLPSDAVFARYAIIDERDLEGVGAPFDPRRLAD